MSEKAELVFDAKAVLGEGPCWDSEKQLLYWVNIEEKKVCIFDPAANENREIQLEERVSAIVPRTSGGAVITLENGFYFLDLETEKISRISEPEIHLTNNRFNDGKCDSKGRFWAGTMDMSDNKEQGALYCLDTDLRTIKKWDKLSLSNGLAWSPDNKFFYLIDTPTKKVLRFDFHILTGGIENPVEIIDFPDDQGMPDGMTIDDEGMLWIAHWGGSKVSRWDPQTGKQLSSIEVPALNVTSCTFGGEDFSELYITTARNGMNDEQLAKYPLSGGLFKVKTGVKGLPAYSFNDK
ncbi:SMP-30/gluconolactonase/LRE family protein [Actinomycetes bacterium NPDC127524]